MEKSMAAVPDLSLNYSQSNPGIDPHIYGAEAQPFKAAPSGTATVSAGVANVTTLFNPLRYSTARIYNASANPVNVEFGGSGVVATASSMVIPAGQTEVVTIPGMAQYVAMLAPAGTSSVTITPGDGV